MNELAILCELRAARYGREITYAMESFWIRAVDSRNSVSFGGSLWNTTLEIEDLPLLKASVSMRNIVACEVSLTVFVP